ncbi:MAG: MBL fold metallo-hydrolase [archaeon]|nr:MBL fold metallo-hydrolase [Candidatus Micrarchaeota archaeon]
MKLKFLGGAREVGKSSFLLDAGDKILLDRGVKLGHSSLSFPLAVKANLKAAIISHAHLDHSGALPELFNTGNTMVYMTSPTLDLSEMLWRDTIKIAEIEGQTKKYSMDEVKKTERFTFPINYRKKVQITDEIMMEFFDAGHIIGSAITKLWYKNKSLVYTGDFHLRETRLLNGADTRIGKTDYLIIESTYGDRHHEKRKTLEKRFVESVQDTINKGGWAIVPAFAVGRSQEILDILHEYKIEAPIFFDGMGQKASAISLRYPEFLKDPKFLGNALHAANWVKGRNRSKALKEPSIIVTSAGMLEGGPVIFYLSKLFDDKNSKVFLTGYQVEGTNGRNLLEKGVINLDGEKVKVNTEVELYEFSAHAEQNELLELIQKLEPEKVFLVHGDEEVIEVFAKEVKALGFEAVKPRNGEEIELK